MLRAIPSLMAARLSYDSDAYNLFVAAQISDVGLKNDINNLIVSSKNNGWWDLQFAIYGMAGDNILQTYASQYKYNWKDPRDLDAAFRLSLIASPTCDANGIAWDGSTQYANTFLVPNTVLSSTSASLSYYSRSTGNTGQTRNDIGEANPGADNSLSIRYNDLFYPQIGNQVLIPNVANTDATGLYMATRGDGVTIQGYKNGAQVVNSAQVSALSTQSIYIGADNNNGSPFGYSQLQCAFATVGSNINSTIAALMYTDIQNFQIARNRQV